MELRSPAHRVLLAPQDCGRYRTRRTSGNMHLHSLAVTTSAIGSGTITLVHRSNYPKMEDLSFTARSEDRNPRIGFQNKIIHLATAVELVIKPRMRMVSPR